MQNLCNELYVAMQRELEQVRSAGLPPRRETEDCFEICMKYTNRLRLALEDYEFNSPEEEIQLFRKIKPGFTAELNFYKHCYYAIVFRPSPFPHEILKFLKKEKQKLEIFIREHQAFYQYIKSGSYNLDRRYFRRRLNGLIPIDTFTTEGDVLLSEFLALERYDSYIKVEISKYRL